MVRQEEERVEERVEEEVVEEEESVEGVVEVEERVVKGSRLAEAEGCVPQRHWKAATKWSS